MKSIENCTDFGSFYEVRKFKKKAMVLFVKMIISCIARNAPTDARYVFAQREVGNFLVGYLLGVLPKGLQGTKHRSPEAAEVRCSKSGVYGFSSSLKK
ncbi:hypothetical protein QYF36_015316 [Acer negundo]|nr:hypothetical protein QYF36_015316 [Acer negundo]